MGKLFMGFYLLGWLVYGRIDGCKRFFCEKNFYVIICKI